MADLLLQGLNQVELREKVIQENIFQVNTESRKREIASAILARLKPLDDYIKEKIVHADLETSKLLVLYAILKSDLLFYEFMNEVYREKVTVLDLELTDRDFHLFFEGKRQQCKVVADWKEYTFYKLQQVYIRIMFEAGLLKNQKEPRKIAIGMMDIDVRDYLINIGDQKYVKILVGE